ncbi:MAG: Nramp family divalent metal transporter [Acidobacteria bacterium]|nr:Nramp family divalent metal transporter [Acidobacteriota bacterium]
MNATEPRLPPPPRALISTNPLQWIRFFGPGAILASVTVGSGEILFPSRGGAIFGFSILWVILFVAFLKWIFVYTSIRHMILSGGHPLERWRKIPGPSGWFPLFLIVIVTLATPLWFSFLTGLTGQICTAIAGVGDQYLWATLSVVGAIALLSFGGYQFLEKAQTIILGLMVVCIVVAVFYVAPPWLQVLQGFFPQALSYPDWLYSLMPQMRDRSVWVEVVVYSSAIGGQSYDYLGYLSFLREKKWGWSHLETATPEQLEGIAARKDHPARLWLRAALVDTGASFFMVVFIGACFAILGTVILQPDQQVPEGLRMLTYQAAFLTTLHPWLLPLYHLAVFLAFFGILYGGPELSYRVLFEYLKSMPRFRNRLPLRGLRTGWILWALGGGILVLWWSRFNPEVRLLDIVTPAGIYTGVLSCGLYALANLWMDRRFLPLRLRMGSWLVALNVASAIALSSFGLKALWDYDQFRGYLVLALFLALCFLLARLLRFVDRAALPLETAGSRELGEPDS